MATWNTQTTVGLIIHIIGVILIIIGIILFEQNQRDRKDQNFWVYFLLIGGLVASIVGGIILGIGLSQSDEVVHKTTQYDPNTGQRVDIEQRHSANGPDYLYHTPPPQSPHPSQMMAGPYPSQHVHSSSPHPSQMMAGPYPSQHVHSPPPVTTTHKDTSVEPTPEGGTKTTQSTYSHPGDESFHGNPAGIASTLPSNYAYPSHVTGQY